MEWRGTQTFEFAEYYIYMVVRAFAWFSTHDYKLYIRDLKFICCMKNNDNDLVSSCFEYVSNNANSILGNKIACFREKYRIQHDFSNLNKAIKMIEQASVLSGVDKSLIDSVWSLILEKSNQYTVEGFDFAEINDMLCFLVTS